MEKLVIKTQGNSVQIGANVYQKGRLSYTKCPDGIALSGREYKYQDVECDGVVQASVEELYTWLNANLFKNGGGDVPVGVLTIDDTAMMPLDGKIPVYSPQGVLNTNMPLFPENCISLAYLQSMIVIDLQLTGFETNETLSAKYPNAVIGFTICCPNSRTEYKKVTDTNWRVNVFDMI